MGEEFGLVDPPSPRRSRGVFFEGGAGLVQRAQRGRRQAHPRVGTGLAEREQGPNPRRGRSGRTDVGQVESFGEPPDVGALHRHGRQGQRLELPVARRPRQPQRRDVVPVGLDLAFLLEQDPARHPHEFGQRVDRVPTRWRPTNSQHGQIADITRAGLAVEGDQQPRHRPDARRHRPHLPETERSPHLTAPNRWVTCDHSHALCYGSAHGFPAPRQVSLVPRSGRVPSQTTWRAGLGRTHSGTCVPRPASPVLKPLKPVTSAEPTSIGSTSAGLTRTGRSRTPAPSPNAPNPRPAG